MGRVAQIQDPQFLIRQHVAAQDPFHFDPVAVGSNPPGDNDDVGLQELSGTDDCGIGRPHVHQQQRKRPSDGESKNRVQKPPVPHRAVPNAPVPNAPVPNGPMPNGRVSGN